LFKKWIDKLEEKIIYASNQDLKPDLFSFAWLLICVSCMYGLVVKLRIILYGRGVLKQKTLPCFVISIGNIIVGGTGKTPMAIYLAKLLKKMGKRVVVISRGYKGKYSNDSLIVSQKGKIFCDVKECGDEPYMMAKEDAFPVVVGKNRFKAGIKAIKAFNPDVIVLDDGFQHIQLKRDLDLLLFDYSNPLGNKRLLPAGRLRETRKASQERVDAIIFTRCLKIDENSENSEKLVQGYPDCPWFKTFHIPYVAAQISNQKNSKKIVKDLSFLKGKNAIIFSGIANNSNFYLTLKKLGINILEHLEFKDHYRYRNEDILRINKTAQKVCADMILTTEKDWIKFNHNVQPGCEWVMDLVVIGVKIEFEQRQNFKVFLKSELKKK
jgi:tetraacyldisaccharide 4'-kinase